MLARWQDFPRRRGNRPERTRLVGEDREEGASSRVPVFIQELIAQLRGVTERLERLGEIGARIPLAPGALPLASLRNLPLPGAISAAQLASIASSIAAQRSSIEALKAQLSAFDEQLAVLERILDPLADWSRTWADLEERLLTLGRKPGDDPGSTKTS